MSDNWVTFDHNKVVHVWVCPDEECDCRTFVYPWYYENRGTPTCPECERDMTYTSTEINLG